MFSFSKIHSLFTKEETEIIIKSVMDAEKDTSGEIRIFIENHCSYMDPIYRAYEIFSSLKMHDTINRNAILIYIAYKDKDFALYSDKNFYEKTTEKFWSQLSHQLAKGFREDRKVESLVSCIQEIGRALTTYYPFHGEQKNELPDEIVFGK